MYRSMKTAMLVVLAAIIGAASASAAVKGSNILFILDSSGSMAAKLGTETKMQAAKRVFNKLIGELPTTVDVGLEVYGHYGDRDCSAIDVMVPVRKLDAPAIKAKVNGLKPLHGATPIAASLEKAADALRGLEGSKTIVLISDGEETCGGDPVAAAGKLRRELGVDFVVHVVGFGVNDDQKKQLAGIATAGGGNYYGAKDAAQLAQGLQKIKETVVRVAAAPKAEIFFKDDFEGGELGAHWEVLNANDEEYIVEDGKLLIISTTKGGFRAAKHPNIFKLNKAMPKGNWRATAKFNVDLQTVEERVYFGLLQDDKNWITSTLGVRRNKNTGHWINVFGIKSTKGKEKYFKKSLAAMPCNICGKKKTWEKFVEKSVRQPFYLRIEKKGRSYFASAKMEGMSWVAADKLTALRAKGNLAFALGQRTRVDGESVLYLDSIEIETMK